MKLYIIGNGFDLHHSLKTSYCDFCRYLKEHDRDLFDNLEKYIFHDPNVTSWSNFEECLAKLDVRQILSDNSSYLPKYQSEDYRIGDNYAFPDAMRNLYETLVTGIFSNFRSFIERVEYSNESFSREIVIDRNAKFLTFNYTNTLEEIYSIEKKNIVYIHGSALPGRGEIVLGHGVNPDSFNEQLPEPPDDLDPERWEEWYLSHTSYTPYDEGREALMQFFQDTFKPTSHIIQKHSYFFHDLADVDEVLVFGHSMALVDKPYFDKVIECIDKSANWTFSYFGDTSVSGGLLNSIEALGIESKSIRLIRLTDLLKLNRQMGFEFCEKG